MFIKTMLGQNKCFMICPYKHVLRTDIILGAQTMCKGSQIVLTDGNKSLGEYIIDKVFILIAITLVWGR